MVQVSVSQKVSWSELHPGWIVFTSSGAGPYRVRDPQNHVLEETNGTTFQHHGELLIPPYFIMCYGAIWAISPFKVREMLENFTKGLKVEMKDYGTILGESLFDFGTISIDEGRRILDTL